MASLLIVIYVEEHRGGKHKGRKSGMSLEWSADMVPWKKTVLRGEEACFDQDRRKDWPNIETLERQREEY